MSHKILSFDLGIELWSRSYMDAIQKQILCKLLLHNHFSYASKWILCAEIDCYHGLSVRAINYVSTVNSK